MKTIFVTATDTGVGKTLACGLLLAFLRRAGINAAYQKWVATGCPAARSAAPAPETDSAPAGADLPEDLRAVRQWAGLGDQPLSPAELARQVPYRFALAASPHLAAEQEKQRIESEVLRNAWQQAESETELLLLEGVGGVMVPLTRELLLADLVADLKIPALLVARGGLGTINHTLLSLEALRRREIPVLGVILSDEAPNLPEIIVADNRRVIAELGRTPVLGRLPWVGSLQPADQSAAHAAFTPIGEAVLAAWQNRKSPR